MCLRRFQGHQMAVYPIVHVMQEPAPLPQSSTVASPAQSRQPSQASLRGRGNDDEAPPTEADGKRKSSSADVNRKLSADRRQRPLVWHSGCVGVLFTGSADSTIRLDNYSHTLHILNTTANKPIQTIV